MTGLKAKLAERIAAGKVLVVVGTGVSLASTNGERLASWKGLITNGIEHCAELGLRDTTWVTSQKELLEGDLDDLLGVAEQASRRLGWEPTEPCGGDWNGWLRGTVGGLRAKYPELIEAIRDLGVPIATLNYDNLLTEVTGYRPIPWHGLSAGSRSFRAMTRPSCTCTAIGTIRVPWSWASAPMTWFWVKVLLNICSVRSAHG